MYTPQSPCGVRRQFVGVGSFLPPTMWIPKTELKFPTSAASALTHQTITLPRRDEYFCVTRVRCYTVHNSREVESA